MFGLPKFLGLHGKNLDLAIAVIAGLDFFLFGYDQGVMGGLVLLPSFVATFPQIDTLNTSGDESYRSTLLGITVASYTLGCFFGALLTIYVSDILGRRRTIFCGCVIMLLGASLQTSAYSLGHLIAGRIITGIGNGMNTSTVPTWQSETSRSHQRGKLVMIEGAMITGGVMTSYWVDFGFSFLEPNTISWRFPVALQLLFALIILIFILDLPESPRWLVLKGRDAEALEILAVLRDLPSNDSYIQTEITAIKEGVLESTRYSYKDLFTMGPERNFHRVVLAYVNQVFQQISGINLITYYAATIFEGQLGLSGTTSRILAAANGTEYFLASFIAVYTIEKFGRRNLMLFGAAGMSASMAILAGTNAHPGYASGIVSALFLFIFNTFFAIGWLGMTWLYPAEIVPLNIRARANALSTSANWIFNFLVVMITPVCFSSIGYQTYIIFAVINAFIFPVVYFFYPETAGRSLEEMDLIFRKTKNVLSVVSTAEREPHQYGKNGELLVDPTVSVDRMNGPQSVRDDKAGIDQVEYADRYSGQTATA